MIIPIEKGFALVGVDGSSSPREQFERRAEEIALAAELHVRRLIRDEVTLLEKRPVEPGSWRVDPESRDAVPFGLKRRVLLRVPVFPPETAAVDESERELRQVRALMARLALDMIAQVIEINRYFAETGLVKAPEDSEGGGRTAPPEPPGEGGRRSAPPEPPGQEPERESAGKTMSGGSAGSSLRRRA
jgi:hypothetical protein